MSDPQARAAVADREASAWLVTLGEACVTAETLAAFQAWRALPVNAEAYQRMERLWRQTGSLAGDPDIQALTRDALAVKAPPRAVVSGRTWAAVLATGAVAVACLAFGGTWLLSRGVYATEIGEQRLVHLEDGSMVQLDTDSRVRVRLHRDRREVALLSGQALFTVSHDAARPFRVVAGETEVTALGTIFDVRRLAAGERVTLVQGAVDVRNVEVATQVWRLAPGDQVIAAPAAQPRRVDVALETSWVEGRLVFRDVPLKQAVAEVNRYLTDKIVLSDGAFADATLNGVFKTGDRDAFVSAAAEVFNLTAVPLQDGRVRLSPARPTSQN